MQAIQTNNPNEKEEPQRFSFFNPEKTNPAVAGFDWQKWLPWMIGGGGLALLPLLMQYFRPQPKSFLQQLLGR